MLDRSTAPKIIPITHHKISFLKKIKAANDTCVYVLSGGNQDIVKIEFVFGSGYMSDKKIGVTLFTANMLLEGTEKNNFEAIAKCIKQYGASIDINTGVDSTHITLLCMSCHLNEILSIFEEIMLMPKFSIERLNQTKAIKKNAILLNEAIVNKVAYKEFKKKLYPDHNYGKTLTINDIEAISLIDIQECYNNKLFINCSVFVSGFISDDNLLSINQSIETVAPRFFKKTKSDDKINSCNLSNQIYNVVVNEEPLQAAICMGKITIKKENENFADLLITNTLLGGYFGSRLMKNIREKNGFTYNIRSSITTLQHSAFVSIKAEVDEKFSLQTHQEIKNELNRLINEPCEDEELANLKNYLHGMLLSNTDNPIALMEKIKSTYLYNLDEGYYDKLYESIMNFENKKLITICNKYFKHDEMITIIAK